MHFSDLNSELQSTYDEWTSPANRLQWASILDSLDLHVHLRAVFLTNFWGIICAYKFIFCHVYTCFHSAICFARWRKSTAFFCGYYQAQALSPHPTTTTTTIPHFLRRKFKRLRMCLPGLCNRYSESNHCVYTTCTQWLRPLLASVFDKQEVSAFCPDLILSTSFWKKALWLGHFKFDLTRNKKITVWPDYTSDCTVVIAAFHCYVHTMMQKLTVCWQYLWFQIDYDVTSHMYYHCEVWSSRLCCMHEQKWCSHCHAFKFKNWPKPYQLSDLGLVALPRVQMSLQFKLTNTVEYIVCWSHGLATWECDQKWKCALDSWSKQLDT